MYEGPWTILMSISTTLVVLLAVGNQLWKSKKNGAGPGSATHDSQREIVTVLQTQTEELRLHTSLLRHLCDATTTHDARSDARRDEMMEAIANKSNSPHMPSAPKHHHFGDRS